MEEIFTSKFGKEAKPEETSVGDYFVMDIITLSEKMIHQLECKINEEKSWQLLPATHNFSNDFGSCQMPATIQNLVSYMSSGDYVNAISFLNQLIYYQIANGFWEQRMPDWDKKKKIEEINTIESHIKLLSSHLDNRRKQYEELLNTTNNLKTQLDEFISNKNNEYNLLTETLEKSKQIYSKMSQTEENANEKYSEIESLKDNINELKQKIESTQDEIKQSQQDMNNNFSVFKTDSEKLLNDSDKKLQQITEDYLYVNDKKSEVKKMMGYISDGTLSHSFNSRKTKIEKMNTIWLWLSFVSIILLCVWIFIIFEYFPQPTENVIVNIIINFIKTTPLFVLFGFSLKQYSKERNLVEEYAFREAIAVTLTAYAEQIENTDKENSDKIDLIRKTVDKLYTKPQITNENIDYFKSKDFADLLKEVLATSKT